MYPNRWGGGTGCSFLRTAFHSLKESLVAVTGSSRDLSLLLPLGSFLRVPLDGVLMGLDFLVFESILLLEQLLVCCL